MALAALMTRKQRDRRREIELREKMQDPEIELTGKEAEEAMKMKAAHETIKKILIGKELLRQKSKSFDALSQASYQDNVEDEQSGFKNSDSAIYIGLILVCIGVVITFVGLGEKGFKTLQLKLIGPTLCLVGLACILLKIIQCAFPQLFQYPAFFKRRKLSDKERTVHVMERGTPNSKTSSTKRKKGETPEKDTNASPANGNGVIAKENEDDKGKKGPKSQPIISPRVVLHSSKNKPTASARPRSTIPNYIEASSDDDDFDPETNWRGSNEPQIQEHLPPQHQTPKNFQNKGTPSPPAISNPNNPVKAPTPPIEIAPESSTITTNTSNKQQNKKDEILLTPKGLML